MLACKNSLLGMDSRSFNKKGYEMDRIKSAQRNSSSNYHGIEMDDMPKKETQAEFPENFQFRRPNKTEFTVEHVPSDWTVGDLYNHVTSLDTNDPSGVFLCNRLEYELSIGNKIYPAETKLEKICEEVDSGRLGYIEFAMNSLKIAKDKLDKRTGIGWEIMEGGQLKCKNNEFGSRPVFDNFLATLFLHVPHLKNFCEISFPVKKHGYSPPEIDISRGFAANITIKGADVIKIIDEQEEFEIKHAAPVIAQATRQSAGMDLGAMPLDVLARLGEFLAPELTPIKARELMQEKINAANRNYQEAPVFTKLQPVEALGVRGSIGATAYKLLNGKHSDGTGDAMGSRVANIDFSNHGMTLRFHDKDYGKRFAFALRNAGYSSASYTATETKTQYGTYQANVTLSSMHEIKNFIELTCGYPAVYTSDLFKIAKEKIILPPDFFVDQLKRIGESSALSATARKESAKALMADYLGYLDPAGARLLKERIVSLSRLHPGEDGAPLQFLRENTGVGRLLPGDLYSDNVGTYKQILAKLDEVIARTAG